MAVLAQPGKFVSSSRWALRQMLHRAAHHATNKLLWDAHQLVR